MYGMVGELQELRRHNKELKTALIIMSVGFFAFVVMFFIKGC